MPDIWIFQLNKYLLNKNEKPFIYCNFDYYFLIKLMDTNQKTLDILNCIILLNFCFVSLSIQ